MDISNTLLCVPNRLSDDKDSFLYHYPYNIVIIRIAMFQGNNAFFTFEYQPDPDTYANWKMVYYNSHNREYYLKYSYDPDTNIYQVSKYHKHKIIGRAQGRDSWELFFQHVSLLSPVEGEPCMISMINA